MKLRNGLVKEYLCVRRVMRIQCGFCNKDLCLGRRNGADAERHCLAKCALTALV